MPYTDKAKSAARIMESKRVRRLPVIDANKRMVGMLAPGAHLSRSIAEDGSQSDQGSFGSSPVRLGSGPNDARRDTQSEGLPDAPHSDPERQSSDRYLRDCVSATPYHDISSTRLSQRIPEFPPTPASQFGLRHLGEGATFPAPARSSLIPLLSDNQAKCSKIAAKWQAESRMSSILRKKSTGSPAIKPNVSSNAVTTRR